jgi:hypothetical protein
MFGKLGQRPAAAVALKPQPEGEAVAEIVYNSIHMSIIREIRGALKPELKRSASGEFLVPSGCGNYLPGRRWG